MVDALTGAPRRKVVAMLSDLMFTVKIQDAAKRAGLDAVFVKTQAAALARAAERPAAIILDLNDAGTMPLELIACLKGDDATRAVPLIGYVSHVQVDVRRGAEESGCDLVMARSVFVDQLPLLLERIADGSR